MFESRGRLKTMFVPGTTSKRGRSHVTPSLRDRERRVLLVAGHVPHLEHAIGRIEKHAVAERPWPTDSASCR